MMASITIVAFFSKTPPEEGNGYHRFFSLQHPPLKESNSSCHRLLLLLYNIAPEEGDGSCHRFLLLLSNTNR